MCFDFSMLVPLFIWAIFIVGTPVAALIAIIKYFDNKDITKHLK